MINLRDKGAEIWERANRIQRIIFVLVLLLAIPQKKRQKEVLDVDVA